MVNVVSVTMDDSGVQLICNKAEGSVVMLKLKLVLQKAELGLTLKDYGE